MLLSNLLAGSTAVQEVFQKIDDIIWGPPLLILLVGTGIYLTIRLKLLQIFKFERIIGNIIVVDILSFNLLRKIDHRLSQRYQ